MTIDSKTLAGAALAGLLTVGVAVTPAVAMGDKAGAEEPKAEKSACEGKSGCPGHDHDKAGCPGKDEKSSCEGKSGCPGKDEKSGCEGH